MTVSGSGVKTTHSGNGSTTAFSYPNYFFQTNDLEVWVVEDSTGTRTNKTEGVDYTVSGTAVDGVYPDGGTVTFSVAPASGYTVHILRNTDLTQSTDYQENEAFPADSHEQGLDKLTLAIQENNYDLGRAVTISENTSGFDPELPSTLTARRAIMIDSDGTGLELSTYDPDTLQTAAAASAAAAEAAQAAAEAAQAAAETAQTNAETAETNAETAQTSAEAAQAAAEAALAGAGLPSISGEALKSLRVKSDASGYELVKGIPAPLISGNTTITTADMGKFYNCGASLTLTLPSAASAGDGWWVAVRGNGGAVTIQSSSGTVDGVASIVLQQMESCIVVCRDGTDFRTIGFAIAASETRSGKVELANSTEGDALTDTARVITPAILGGLIATQSDQETGTAVNRLVTSGRQHYHPSAAKAWGYSTYSGGIPSANESYNVSSISDTGTGTQTWNLGITLSSANYCAQTSTLATGSGNVPCTPGISSRTTTTLVTITQQNTTLLDRDMNMTIFGDI